MVEVRTSFPADRLLRPESAPDGRFGGVARSPWVSLWAPPFAGALSSKNVAGAFFVQRRIPELACSASLVERAFNLKKLFDLCDRHGLGVRDRSRLRMGSKRSNDEAEPAAARRPGACWPI